MCQGRPRSAFRIEGELTSRVAWLDHDDKQRKAMLEIVDLFREKDTVDDLGYGIVRDAISDTLFPGVSVLHTRPRYMLLIGWIYAGLLDDGISGQRAIDQGRKRELALSQTLLEAGETQGVIGRVAGKSLKRLPSAAYWAAIRTYGLLSVNSSLETYCRSIPVLRQSETVFEEGQRSQRQIWRLPPTPEGFPEEGVSLEFSAAEAHFLYERVMHAAGHSYLGLLLNHSVDEGAETPWAHPAAADAPERIRDDLTIAEYYSLAQHGPSLLYNKLVAQAARREDLVEDYEDRLTTWAEEINARFPTMPFALSDLWSLVDRVGARVTHRAREFIEWTLTLTPDQRSGLVRDRPAAERIALREYSLKRALSRLEGKRSLDSWSGSSGAGLLTYRWSSVVPMVRDIVTAREGSHA